MHSLRYQYQIFTKSLVATILFLLITISTSYSTTLTMVEGHSVHRLASRFRTKLVGRRFTASSPNGRFTDGAAAIDGKELSRMEAVGKNLFAFFSNGNSSNANRSHEDDVVVHVHFGMSGAWAVYNSIEDEEDVRPTIRLRLEEIPATSHSKQSSSYYVTHLSAMTVQHSIGRSLYLDKKASLGQDPLRSDADPNILFTKVSKSKKSIAQLIMDQSYFAGPGNIYRAEILFLAGVYPTTPGISLDRAAFDRIWNVTVKLLRRGYDTGSILTVDASVDPEVEARGERRYIYNKSHCARCGGIVNSWDVSGRTCYACDNCQPKLAIESAVVATGSEKKAGKKKKKDAIKKEGGNRQCKEPQKLPHVPFISHCAPINLQQRIKYGGADQLTISEIRSVLEQMIGADDDVSLPPKSARKAVHVEALNNLLLNRKMSATPSKVMKESPSKPLPPPIVSAEDAAREKYISGENRAVEHVAELSGGQAKSCITPSPMAVKGGKPKVSKKVAAKRKRSTEDESSKRKLKYGS